MAKGSETDMDGNRYSKEFRVQKDGNTDMAKGSETDMD
jgi:hypothetical protein